MCREKPSGPTPLQEMVIEDMIREEKQRLQREMRAQNEANRCLDRLNKTALVQETFLLKTWNLPEGHLCLEKNIRAVRTAEHSLQAKLWSSAIALKNLEDDMLEETLDQLKISALRLEKKKEALCELEQAQFALDAWEDLFLLFVQDRSRRRESWMEDRFYYKVREDISKKLAACHRFSKSLAVEARDALVSAADLAGIENRNFSYREEAEFEEELLWYGQTLLFIENRLYEVAKAMEEQRHAKAMLKMLGVREVTGTSMGTPSGKIPAL